MKSKIYKVFSCGCRSLDHARLRIGHNKFQNCCPKHGLNGPVIRKEYTCAECGELVELPPDTKGGTFQFCKKCAEAKRIKDRHDRREVIRAKERRITGTPNGQQTKDEVKFIRNIKSRETLRNYYETMKSVDRRWQDVDVDIDRTVVLTECEKRLGGRI